MSNQSVAEILAEWLSEFNITLSKNNSLCLALISTDKELLFANETMLSLFRGDAITSFINPSIDKLLLLEHSTPLIFDGFITLGDYSSINTSIWAQVYRKANKLLILGGINTSQLIDQNITMHQLNREISNLQRELIKEKYSLESTLNQLNKANVELKKLNATKDKFFSIIAHDLRNPFSSLLGMSELLLNNYQNYSDEKRMEIIKLQYEVSEQTLTLLKNLLEWSKIQRGKIEYTPKTINLLDLITNQLDDFMIISQQKNIQITHYCSSEIFIQADANMLSSIFRNLIGNAIKFTHEEGMIQIFVVNFDDSIEITIADNGIGISPEDLDKLFTLEHNISKFGTSNEKGSGLGLILVKEFIELHGGKIWIESEINKGSSFVFTLPKTEVTIPN